jgi:hypothetical protein
MEQMRGEGIGGTQTRAIAPVTLQTRAIAPVTLRLIWPLFYSAAEVSLACWRSTVVFLLLIFGSICFADMTKYSHARKRVYINKSAHVFVCMRMTLRCYPNNSAAAAPASCRANTET